MSFNVLVLCTGNSARSILGEMLFKHLGQGRINAWSAGSKPGGVVNPVAIETLQKHGIPCEEARSKSWDEFDQAKDPSAIPPVPRGFPSVTPTFNFIFTVCSNAANETCPVWPGHPTTVHWTIPDPAHVEPMAARRKAFEAAYQSLHKRITAFLALPLESMSREEALTAARRIHEEA
jgi:arsenate reductase